jgi:hypothetical protein
MLRRNPDAPNCRRRGLLGRIRALFGRVRNDDRCGDWFEELPPDSFVREPRRPLPPSLPGSVALEPPPDAV